MSVESIGYILYLLVENMCDWEAICFFDARVPLTALAESGILPLRVACL